jgi:hypothetical protein
MSDMRVPEPNMGPYSLSIVLRDNDVENRPAFEVVQQFESGHKSTLRHSISPGVAVPSWLIQDVLATFHLALLNAVRYRYGVQEELELAPVHKFDGPPAGLRTVE